MSTSIQIRKPLPLPTFGLNKDQFAVSGLCVCVFFRHFCFLSIISFASLFVCTRNTNYMTLSMKILSSEIEWGKQIVYIWMEVYDFIQWNDITVYVCVYLYTRTTKYTIILSTWIKRVRNKCLNFIARSISPKSKKITMGSCFFQNALIGCLGELAALFCATNFYRALFWSCKLILDFFLS